MLDRDRFEKCLALAEGGATAGERAAGRAAAERIAASAGLTFAEARETLRAARPGARGPGARRAAPRRPHAWAEPAAPVKPITVEELLRQKAETEAWRLRAAAAAGRRRRADAAEQAAYEAGQRKAQAERDRAWAQAGTRKP